MTAVTEAMKLRPFAKENIVSVRNRSSGALMASVFRQDGVATTRMTAATIRTKRIAKIINAKMARSNALRAIVLRRISAATAIVIAAICPTKLIVRHDSQAADTVPNHDSSAPIICASRCLTFATAPTIAATIAMRRHRFARISIATHCDASNVPIIAVSHVIKFAMVSIIAATAVTKII